MEADEDEDFVEDCRRIGTPMSDFVPRLFVKRMPPSPAVCMEAEDSGRVSKYPFGDKPTPL